MRSLVVVPIVALLALAGCGGGEEPAQGPTNLTTAEIAHSKALHLEARQAARRSDAVASLKDFERKAPREARRSRALCRKGAATGPTFQALAPDCLKAVAAGQRFSRAVITGARCEDLDCTIRFLRRLAIEFARVDRLSQTYVRKTEGLQITDACRTILVGSEATLATSRRLVSEVEAALDAARAYRDAPIDTAEERAAEKSYDQTYEKWFGTLGDFDRQLDGDLRIKANACA